MTLNRRHFIKAGFTLATLTLFSPSITQAEVRRRVRCPILMYHYVSPLPSDADKYRVDLTVLPDNFYAHCEYLAQNNYQTVTMGQLYGALMRGDKLPARRVVMTFDDGYDDAYTQAFPILQQFGMAGTFFVVRDFMEQPGYLTWVQAGEMLAEGMEIENHSTSHIDLRDLDRETLLYQIGAAADAIQNQVGRRPKVFCYPGGRYDALAVQVVQETGHIMAVTTADGLVHTSSDLLLMTRARVRGTTGVQGLEWLIGR
ncbi:MAG: polysaccharide deacetylase family protein [Chloroflexi bacterium]|nr:polysaccharide deacetylase family protein [Chloroflexota bacterium]